jgi:hypothetical protein
MNSIMERWIQACRHELLDRKLIWNQAHLLHAFASTNATITIIVLTGASRTPGRSVRCPNYQQTGTFHAGAVRESIGAGAIASSTW